MPADSASTLTTIADAARAWHVSEITVRRLLISGAVRGIRIAGCWRISRDEIARVLLEGTSRPYPAGLLEHTVGAVALARKA
jgi:hypothetical protein